ncbi:hypothetical protein PUN28_010965 [Cardiocondyla obscurior]|uniref:Uncharacterized protein n=1 Tax=Cardiocondyla obscurior TaxID=286306 RepID=A0AAW2FK31_9HYME
MEHLSKLLLSFCATIFLYLSWLKEISILKEKKSESSRKLHSFQEPRRDRGSDRNRSRSGCGISGGSR